MSAPDSMIAKIKALFATAQCKVNHDGTSNEAEAASAAALAQKLLLKYNLDIRTVQDAAVKTGGAVEEGKRDKQTMKRTAMYRWQTKFWKALAELNMCFYWVTEIQERCAFKWCHCWKEDRLHTVKRHVILGSEANVAVVMAMGDYLTETIERLITMQYGTATHSKSATSWREGCSERLIERLTEQMAKIKAEGFSDSGTTCTAIAVQDLHEKEYAANYDARYGAGAYSRMKQRDSEWEAGRAAREAKWAADRRAEEEERARTLAGETAAQRSTRERKEAREQAKQRAADARWWDRQYRKQQREEERRDTVAYARGHHKANDINLNSQVGSGKKQGGLN